jgi:hypothetical protein
MSYTKTSFTFNVTNLDDVPGQMRMLVRWINQELLKVEEESKLPQLQGIKFERIYAVPAKYEEGDMYYFEEGIANAPGLFIRDDNNWRRL